MTKGSQDEEETTTEKQPAKRRQEKEFKSASLYYSDDEFDQQAKAFRVHHFSIKKRKIAADNMM